MAPLREVAASDFRYSRVHQRLRDGADDLGFSNGGMTALQLAIRHLALVRRAVRSRRALFDPRCDNSPTVRAGPSETPSSHFPRPSVTKSWQSLGVGAEVAAPHYRRPRIS